jgi:hypothetical protein
VVRCIGQDQGEVRAGPRGGFIANQYTQTDIPIYKYAYIGLVISILISPDRYIHIYKWGYRSGHIGFIAISV